VEAAALPLDALAQTVDKGVEEAYILPPEEPPAHSLATPWQSENQMAHIGRICGGLLWQILKALLGFKLSLFSVGLLEKGLRLPIFFFFTLLVFKFLLSPSFLFFFVTLLHLLNLVHHCCLLQLSLLSLLNEPSLI
jgi:hypothetical protein